MTPEQIQLMKIFFPFNYERREKVRTKRIRLVHYTTAETAIHILRNKEFWMRKSTCMNDFMEAEHGWECLVNSYRGKTGDRFRKALDSLYSGISQELEKLIDGWSQYIKNDSYIACFSEHLDTEDRMGRLSMWRAYGRTAGVALVLNNEPFFTPSDALKAYSSPVAYLDGKEFEKKFKKIVTNIEKNSLLLKSLDKNALLHILFSMLRFAIHATKHPGFREEREWRVIHTPDLDKSSRLVKEICTIGGIPQPVYKIPLRNIPEEGFVGVEIPELIERIIIGPADYPSAIMESFADLLSACGVENPAKRIFVSDIPLR